MKHTPRDIKNQALKTKESNPNLKLTQIQHNLVQGLGYQTYQAFLADYEKNYKLDELDLIKKTKTLLFDNNKLVLRSFNKLSNLYKTSERLWSICQETDNPNDENAYEASQEKVFEMVDKIRILTIPNDFYVEYQNSVIESDLRLGFALYYDGLTKHNDYEGRNADYTVVLDGENKTLEIYEYKNLDGFYFDFPQI